MIKVPDAALQKKIDHLFTAGQGHIFNFWSEYNIAQRKHFLKQIASIDLQILEKQLRIFKQDNSVASQFSDLQPSEIVTLKKRMNQDHAVLPLGEEALRNGQVAAFLVAGGQGSRLGFEGPKGVFPITPVKRKTLFQVFAEKIHYLQNKYRTKVPWYIMTSETNHLETVNYFRKNHFFQLNSQAIHFFSQDMLPALDQKGKLILEDKHSLFFNPNGHGGSLSALYKHGALDEMMENGQKQLFYFQVDNVLVNLCDPFFLGYHIAKKAEMSTKVVRKISPDERMGIICQINGRDGVVEYSDLSNVDMQSRTANGELKYWAGNTAIHMFDIEFLLNRVRSGTGLPFHLAEKNIPSVDSTGKRIKSTAKNGVKFETFIFDLLKDVKNCLTLEVERKREFSAVKNKKGSDSPDTAKKDLLWNYADWIEEAGLKIDRDEFGNPKINFEISPHFAANAEDIKNKKDTIPPLSQGIFLG